MTDREKVLKALECCAHVVPRCLECPLKEQKRTFYSGKGCDCHSILADKALTLLAEPRAMMLDAALQTLVDFDLDMPCDVLTDVDDSCYEMCKYNCPTKECWRRFLEVKAKENERKEKQS